MRILLISLWYHPEPRKPVRELAATLREFGHEVTIVTGFPNWPQGEVYPGYRVRPWQRETIDGVSVIRVPLYPDHSRSAFRRAVNCCSFSLAAAVLSPFLARKPDVVYAIQPIPAGLSALFLKSIWRVPLVTEVQDLWPETLQATGFVSSSALLRVVQWLNNWVLRSSVRVRVISEGFRRSLMARGIPAGRIEVISNWVDPDVFRSHAASASQAASPQPSLHVVYAGTIGPAQDLDTLLAAAELVRESKDITFTIAGDGTELKRLENEARARSLTNVRFTGWLPEDSVSQLMDSADVLLVQLRDDPLFRITIPHKTFTYMAMGKPILAAIEGDAADVVREAHAGLTCHPGDPRSLADALRSFVHLGSQGRAELGRQGRTAVCERYCRLSLVKRCEGLIRQATAASL